MPVTRPSAAKGAGKSGAARGKRPAKAPGASREEASQHVIERSLIYWVGLLDARYNQEFQKRIRPRRLATAWFRVLAVLSQKGVLTVKQLAHHSLTERTTLSRQLNRMEHEGLIERREDSDRRVSKICVTARGRAAFEALRPIRYAILTEASRGISPKTIAEIIATVQTMLANLGE